MWAFPQSRCVLALDASSVSGGIFRGKTLDQFARVDLPVGALVVSASEANCVNSDSIIQAVRSVIATLGASGKGARVLLPGGVAKIVLYDEGQQRGAEPRELARFKLARQLPYPEAEAVVDVTPAGRHHHLGAAIRRSVVENYEAVLTRAGVRKDRLDLTPVAALMGLLSTSGEGVNCEVILGDAAVSCAVSAPTGLLAFRSRLRETGPGEPARLAREVERTLRLGGVDSPRRLRIVGPGTTDIVGALSREGIPAEAGWGRTRAALPGESSEIAWLGAVVA